MNIDELEIELEEDYETIEIVDSAIKSGDVEESLPKSYLLVEGLVMINQIVGVVDKDAPLLLRPVYAYKHQELKLVNYVEMTADNIMRMQLLGLTVSLQRQGKEPILFDKAEDYVAIAKTLKDSDTYDIVYSDISSDSPWIERR